MPVPDLYRDLTECRFWVVSSRPARISQRPLFRFSRATTPPSASGISSPRSGPRPAALRSQIALLWASCGLGIPTPMPARNRSPPEKSRALRNSRKPVWAVFRGSAAERIPGFGSGSVREVLGYGFGNHLIVFGFWNASTQIREKIPGIDFGYSSGEAPREKWHRTNPLRFLNLWGRSRVSSLYFQSSALPTELPGLGMRKRVLNSRAPPESSPRGRFPVISRSGGDYPGFASGGPRETRRGGARR